MKPAVKIITAVNPSHVWSQGIGPEIRFMNSGRIANPYMSPGSTIVSHGRQRPCKAALEVVYGDYAWEGIYLRATNIRGRLIWESESELHGNTADSTEEY
jgi:hypothetical protein